VTQSTISFDAVLPHLVTRLAPFVMAALAGFVTSADATYISNDERVEAQAEVSVQNTFQHNDSNTIEWVQDRNEVKLGLRYFLVPVTQDLWFLHRPRISIQYRGRYDSIFDIRDRYQKLGFNREDFRFPEGEYPREIYFDAEFRRTCQAAPPPAGGFMKRALGKWLLKRTSSTSFSTAMLPTTCPSSSAGKNCRRRSFMIPP